MDRIAIDKLSETQRRILAGIGLMAIAKPPEDEAEYAQRIWGAFLDGRTYGRGEILEDELGAKKEGDTE